MLLSNREVDQDGGERWYPPACLWFSMVMMLAVVSED